MTRRNRARDRVAQRRHGVARRLEMLRGLLAAGLTAGRRQGQPLDRLDGLLRREAGRQGLCVGRLKPPHELGELGLLIGKFAPAIWPIPPLLTDQDNAVGQILQIRRHGRDPRIEDELVEAARELIHRGLGFTRRGLGGGEGLPRRGPAIVETGLQRREILEIRELRLDSRQLAQKRRDPDQALKPRGLPHAVLLLRPQARQMFERLLARLSLALIGLA